MSEDGYLLEEFKKLNENIKDLAISIKALAINSQLRAESLDPDLEYNKSPAPDGSATTVKSVRLSRKDEGDTRVEESVEITQDLTNVLLIAESDKAVLAVKNGYQKWVAFSLIQSPKEYDLGGTYDIILRKKKDNEKTDPDNWFHKKPWEKYTPVKGGK